MPRAKKSSTRLPFAPDVLGVTSVEYALIAALLSIVVIGGYTVLSERMLDVFRSLGRAF